MALRHLQLLRNKPIAQKGREAAKNAAKTAAEDLKDGELIVARYLIDTGGTPSETNTAIALGFRVDDGTNAAHTVFYDQRELEEKISGLTGSTEALEKAVGVNHNESSITSHVSSTNYISGATSVVSGLTALDTQLKATDDIAKEVRAAVGSSANTLTANGSYVQPNQTVKEAVQALDTQLKQATDSTVKAHTLLGTTSGDTEFSANGTYVNGKTTVKAAVEALDSAIVNNDAADANLRAVVGVGSGATTLTIPEPNYVGTSPQVSGAIKTLDTVEKNTRDAIGLDGSGNTISLDGTNYMSTATTVKSGLTALDSNLAALSGAVTTNKINPTDTIAVTTADTGTTLDVKISTSATEPSTSGSEVDMHKNIISATTDGLYAFADLHYTASTNTLEFVNTYGKKSVQLTGLKAIKDVGYNLSAETIEIVFETTSGDSKVDIPMAGLINEFEFIGSSESGATQASASQHNVSLVEVRDTGAGTSKIYGEVSIFDCGTY